MIPLTKCSKLTINSDVVTLISSIISDNTNIVSSISCAYIINNKSTSSCIINYVA